MDYSEEQLKRWRLVLGRGAQESLEPMSDDCLTLNSDEQCMDEALAAIYEGV